MKHELPTDDEITAGDPAFEEWWQFFKGTQGIKDNFSVRVYMGAWAFARCAWLAARQEAYRRAAQAIQAQCDAKGTGCLAHCTHPESVQAIKALAGDVNVDVFQRRWEQLINEPDADCPGCGVQPMQMHKAECPEWRRQREGNAEGRP